MEHTDTIKIYLYTRFERFWHWLQALMIVTLMITGFEIHGTFTLFGFQTAVNIHNFAGLSWLVLFVFFEFWLLTTGEWKQYIPTTKKLFAVVMFYSWGIFQGKEHPVQKSKGAKHNPLQRLTYLGLTSVLLPVQMVSGLLYYFYNDISGTISLFSLAILHTMFAIFLIIFLIIHVYMTTTGHTIFGHIAGMITGYEEVSASTKIGEWETADKK